DATPFPYARLAAGLSSRLLRRLRSLPTCVAAAILESLLLGYGTIITVLMARPLGKHERSAHLAAGRLARSARPGPTGSTDHAGPAGQAVPTFDTVLGARLTPPLPLAIS